MKLLTTPGSPTRRHRRSSLLAGTVVIAMGLIGGAAAAQAAPCVVGPGVTQTETSVTGSPGNAAA